MLSLTSDNPKHSIVFFGSGPVAAESLRLLADAFRIEAVITKPRAEHHKGPVPVLELCEELALPSFTPLSKQAVSELFAKQKFDSQAGVVIDYGIIINQDVIDAFPLGIINSHFSLLPEWRGADPISFAILSGQKETGVSLMLINDKMDEGPLLAQSVYALPADITTPQLTSDLIELSDAMLKHMLPLYFEGKVTTRPQLQSSMAASLQPTYSHKLTKDDGLIDWNKPAEQIEREVRAYLEWPKSRTRLYGVDVIITKAHASDENGTPGRAYTADKTLGIYCGQGSLIIDRLKPAGKSDMPAAAFLNGYVKESQ